MFPKKFCKEDVINRLDGVCVCTFLPLFICYVESEREWYRMFCCLFWRISFSRQIFASYAKKYSNQKSIRTLVRSLARLHSLSSSMFPLFEPGKIILTRIACAFLLFHIVVNVVVSLSLLSTCRCCVDGTSNGSVISQKLESNGHLPLCIKIWTYVNVFLTWNRSSLAIQKKSEKWRKYVFVFAHAEHMLQMKKRTSNAAIKGKWLKEMDGKEFTQKTEKHWKKTTSTLLLLLLCFFYREFEVLLNKFFTCCSKLNLWFIFFSYSGFVLSYFVLFCFFLAKGLLISFYNGTRYCGVNHSHTNT